MGVGGPVNARGISFQHAQAVAACVDALESADVAFVRVEGVEDVIDFELWGVGGQRIRVCQAKTRQEPYVWAPGEIVATIKRWKELSDATDAQFEFLTDGSAGDELTKKLLPALRRARTGGLTDADRSYLASRRLDAPESLLARVAVESRQPEADVLLDTVAFQTVRLLVEIGLSESNADRADELVNELFVLVSLRAGKTDPDQRVITREELSRRDSVDRVADFTNERFMTTAKVGPRWTSVSSRSGTGLTTAAFRCRYRFVGVLRADFERQVANEYRAGDRGQRAGGCHPLAQQRDEVADDLLGEGQGSRWSSTVICYPDDSFRVPARRHRVIASATERSPDPSGRNHGFLPTEVDVMG